MKSTQTTTIVAGIDISKAKLDVAIHGTPITFVASNDKAGWQDVNNRLSQAGVTRVGLEATGGYERGITHHLRDAGLDVAVLQPLQVKAFGQLKLRRAKTDTLDAALIAACTQALGPLDRMVSDTALERLADQLTFVEQIEDDIVRFKTRLEHMTDARQTRMVLNDIGRLTKRRQTQLARLAAAVRAHAEWGRRFDLVLSIPGVGERTALAIVLLLPELAQASREQAAALAGLAPFTHTSGKYTGQTHIGGGRERLRTSLYKAAFAAAHHWNPPLKAFYARLKERNLATTSALVACARKLLIFALSVVQRGTPWQDTAPAKT